MIVVYLIFLAVIQAVTEFLPVSSLGHLCILEQYMGIGHETGLLSETMLHKIPMLTSVRHFHHKTLLLPCQYGLPQSPA